MPSSIADDAPCVFACAAKQGNQHHEFLIATMAAVLMAVLPASAQTFSTVPLTGGVEGPTRYILFEKASNCTVCMNPGVTISSANQYASIDQFASVANLNASIAGVNTSIAGLTANYDSVNSSIAGFNATVNAINAQIASANASIAASASGSSNAISGLAANLARVRTEAWTAGALAASLTPVLPQNGMQNHVNAAMATINGVQAFSLNYARVQGRYDVTASAGYARSTAIGKISAGFSW